jgi:hypothetical protein
MTYDYTTKLSADQDEALRLCGYRDARLDSDVREKLQNAAETIERVAKPRWVYKYFVLEKMHAILVGEDIKAHLRNCEGLFLVGMTLGIEVDRVIRLQQVRDIASAMFMDAAASALVDQYAQRSEDMLKLEAERSGRCIVTRYSPGYGDLPLSIQPIFLSAIDAARSIGITLSPGGLMVPQKSITAFIGVKHHDVTQKVGFS